MTKEELSPPTLAFVFFCVRAVPPVRDVASSPVVYTLLHMLLFIIFQGVSEFCSRRRLEVWGIEKPFMSVWDKG